MLDKPKFLTGEVKEFIDWLEHYEYEPQIVGGARSEYGLTKREKINCYEEEMIERREIIGFYNQPFETVMIEKYFEDFNLLSRNGAGEEPHFGFKNGTYHLWFTYYRVIIERNNPSETHKTMLPRTLNHFISDCKRAGIKLEWRE